MNMDMSNLVTTPLQKAIVENRKAIVEFLLDNNFECTFFDLRLALRYNCDIDIIEMLYSKIKISAEEKDNLLFLVESKEAAEFLIDRGCKINVKNAQDKYPHEWVSDRATKEYLSLKFYNYITSLRSQNTLQLKKTIAPNDFAERFSTLRLSVGDFKVNNNDLSSGEFSLSFQGENYTPSSRFLNSLARKLKFSNNIFNYFSGEEVFTRISERNPSVMFKITFDNATNTVLGVVDEDKPILPADIACKILQNDPRIYDISYQDGVIEAFIDINDGFTIDNDSDYARKIYLQFPVDGISVPSLYLAVERQVCSNGMTALVNQFKTDMEINDNSGLHLGKILQTFNNRNGFLALEERIDKAQHTVASVRELLQIQNMLQSQVKSKLYYGRLLTRLEELANDPCAMYQTTALQNINPKRRALLPIGCSVNDLINFSTELVSHHANVLDNPQYIHNFIGRMLSQEFDLEEMYESNQAARDFVLQDVKLNRNELFESVG